jgi:hypothetical protein
MRRVVVGAITLCAVLCLPKISTAQRPVKSSTKTAKSADSSFTPFVGTWKLVSSVQRMPDGTVKPYGFGPRASGYLMYDATGHVCAQVVNPDRPMWVDSDHPTPAEIRTAFDGFGGYCGTFTVNPEKHTLAHIPEISFDPNIVGKPSSRTYSFDAGRLVYEGTADDGESHWTMTWERVQ